MLFAFSLCFMSQCKVKEYAPTELPEEQIEFGTGGGFAGYETAYILLDNGQLFKKSGPKADIKRYNKIPKSLVKSLYKGLEKVNTLDPNDFQPGNLYSFIEKKGETPFRIVWDDFQEGVDKDLRSYFQQLMQSTKK